jgi:hypothetical protein
MGTLLLLPDQHWLDLREHETREALRPILAPTLHALGHDDFDLSDAVGRDRRLTQAIAAFAREQKFDGTAYKSRFDPAFDCWAIFEGALFDSISYSEIDRADPDLLEALTLFGLRLAEDGS